MQDGRNRSFADFERRISVKQFIKILKFELKYYFTNKIFVGVTVFLVALTGIVLFSPRVIEIFRSADTDTETDSDSEKKILLLSLADTEAENSRAVEDAFRSAFPDYKVELTTEEPESIEDKITSGEAECAFLIEDLTSYTYYVNNLSMYDGNTAAADNILQEFYRLDALKQKGLSSEEAQSILNTQVSHLTKPLGKDQMQNFFYTYIMIFALYMVILLYGQMVATNVAAEKSSRAMELLITSAKPVSMMFGKVIASCTAGLLQLTAIFGSALLFFRINEAYWAENAIILSVFDMPVHLFIYMLVFFILGFLTYAFLFGAVGSTASKLEDINTSVMPLTLLFIFGFLVVVISMTSGNVDTLLMKICSFVPFTSPMAMFTRIAMSTVPFYEIAVSVLLLIGSVFGIGVLSAKIYRVGVLLYGAAPKISSIIRAIKMS